VGVTTVSSKYNMPMGTNTKFKLKRRKWNFGKIVQWYLHSAALKKVKYHETLKNEFLNIIIS